MTPVTRPVRHLAPPASLQPKILGQPLDDLVVDPPRNRHARDGRLAGDRRILPRITILNAVRGELGSISKGPQPLPGQISRHSSGGFIDDLP